MCVSESGVRECSKMTALLKTEEWLRQGLNGYGLSKVRGVYDNLLAVSHKY